MPRRSAHQEPNATPRFRTNTRKAPTLVQDTKSRVALMKKHPEFATNKAIAEAALGWLAAAERIDGHVLRISNARAELASALADRARETKAWKRSLGQVLAYVGEACAGSSSAVAEWGFDIATRDSLPPTREAPRNLRVRYTRELQMVVEWSFVPGFVCYQLQMGDGTPEGWADPILLPRGRFTPTGLRPGQPVSFRVRVQRKDGWSEWSTELGTTAR